MKQIPVDPRKTKQLASNLQLAEGERTEVTVNVRTDGGMTNGAGNIIKKIQLHHKNKPSGVIWVQFDNIQMWEKKLDMITGICMYTISIDSGLQCNL